MREELAALGGIKRSSAVTSNRMHAFIFSIEAPSRKEEKKGHNGRLEVETLRGRKALSTCAENRIDGSESVSVVIRFFLFSLSGKERKPGAKAIISCHHLIIHASVDIWA